MGAGLGQAAPALGSLFIFSSKIAPLTFPSLSRVTAATCNQLGRPPCSCDRAERLVVMRTEGRKMMCIFLLSTLLCRGGRTGRRRVVGDGALGEGCWKDKNNIREWTGLELVKSQRAVESGGENRENWLRNHLWCPNDPRG